MFPTETAVRYLQDQTLANFTTLRETIITSDTFSPYANYEGVAQALLAEGKYQESMHALKALLPSGFLSFSLHSMLAYAHQKLGQTEEAQRELFYAKAAMRGILMTGDGSRDRPYQVLQIGDEYDVLRFFGKESIEQTLIRTESESLDQHICRDGAVIWFDITVPSSMLRPGITS